MQGGKQRECSYFALPVAGGEQISLTPPPVCWGQAIGRWGAEAVLAAVERGKKKRGGKGGGAPGVDPGTTANGSLEDLLGLNLLTHCNAGSLATAAYGTALGVIRATAEQGRLGHAFCTETRPYNQGRLHLLDVAGELNWKCCRNGRECVGVLLVPCV